ncbi:hypothetical protein J1614_009894 [Plenodomus biglobosus]|nr:hypothetical protein J1614_009894 [Plenodomus biglobosus]
MMEPDTQVRWERISPLSKISARRTVDRLYASFLVSFEWGLTSMRRSNFAALAMIATRSSFFSSDRLHTSSSMLNVVVGKCDGRIRSVASALSWLSSLCSLSEFSDAEPVSTSVTLFQTLYCLALPSISLRGHRSSDSSNAMQNIVTAFRNATSDILRSPGSFPKSYVRPRFLKCLECGTRSVIRWEARWSS